MNIFQRIVKFFTDDEPTTPEFDELDFVSTPSDDVLDNWLATLNDADKQMLTDTAGEIHRAGRDYMRFLAVLHYLHQTRTDPFSVLVRTARRKVAPLLDRFGRITDNQWTEAELNEWLDSLDDFWRNAMYDRVRSFTSRGGTDIVKLLCALRRNYEAHRRQEAEEVKANRISLLDVWYIWQEEGRKFEQHQAAKELRQHLRDQRKW